MTRSSWARDLGEGRSTLPRDLGLGTTRNGGPNASLTDMMKEI